MRPARGQLTIRTAAGSVQVGATPRWLASVRPGEAIAVRTARFGAAVWVDEPRPLRPAVYGLTGRARGVAIEVNRAAGWLVVDVGERLRLRAHPRRIGSILPGEVVIVDFRRVGGRDWIDTAYVWRAAPRPAVARDVAASADATRDEPAVRVDRTGLAAPVRRADVFAVGGAIAAALVALGAAIAASRRRRADASPR